MIEPVCQHYNQQYVSAKTRVSGKPSLIMDIVRDSSGGRNIPVDSTAWSFLEVPAGTSEGKVLGILNFCYECGSTLKENPMETEELCFLETSHLILRKWCGAPWLSTGIVSVTTLTLSLGASKHQSGRPYFRQAKRKFQTAYSLH